MPRFQFAFISAGSGREAGVVRSENFESALALLDQHITASPGDALEIGVPGFPPMRYECVFVAMDGGVKWRPAPVPMIGQIAA